MAEGSQEEYKKFFDKKLAKWKVKSPAELSDEDKKKFFNEIEKEWTGDKDEEVVKEFIKKDGARRRCAGGDGRKNRKVKTEEEDDEEGLDEAVDKDKVIFLKLFVKDVFKKKIISMAKDIQKKMKSGKYDHKQAPKLWLSLVDEGAKKYAKEFPGIKFSKQEKEEAAQDFADEYRDEGEMF